MCVISNSWFWFPHGCHSIMQSIVDPKCVWIFQLSHQYCFEKAYVIWDLKWLQTMYLACWQSDMRAATITDRDYDYQCINQDDCDHISITDNRIRLQITVATSTCSTTTTNTKCDYITNTTTLCEYHDITSMRRVSTVSSLHGLESADLKSRCTRVVRGTTSEGRNVKMQTRAA